MSLATKKSDWLKSQTLLNDAISQAEEVLLGKREQLRLAFCTILAEGHLLIEDVPGVGKTTLVKLLAKSLGLKTNRIQFTNDLLPADILGTSIYDIEQKRFTFHPGPIFSQLVIFDELNRATPKTQSASLQAMEERKISVDGVTHDLPKPFVVVATQNPREQVGTYALPESQLDRFLMRIELGYPGKQAEQQLLKGERRDVMLEKLQPKMAMNDLIVAQKQASEVFVSDPVVHYVQNILEKSRLHAGDQLGLSPRAGLALLRSAKAWAFLEGREMVLPDDIQVVGSSVMAHRLNRVDDFNQHRGLELALEILDAVKVD